MIIVNASEMNVSSVLTSTFSYYYNNFYNDSYDDTDAGGSVSLLVDDNLDIGTENSTLHSVGSGSTICNSTGWREFNQFYKSWHGETTVLVCIFGCIANLLNLIVLTRKGMISATNGILTGLALADLFTMIEYIPYSFSMYIWKRQYTYGWALYVLFHANFSQVCHTVSIWLTLTLAIWRYIAVGIPTKSMEWCTMNRAKWAIASAYVGSPLLSIPVFLSFSIGSVQKENSTEVQYFADWSELAQKHDRLLAKTNFWIYSVVIKIIPCIVLTVVSFRLINALMEAKRRKEKLLAKRPPRPTIETANSSGTGAQGQMPGGGINKVFSKTTHHENSNETADRTTKMLLAVLLLFLITEFPQGILGLLSGILGDTFFRTCYGHLGGIMDLLALLNSAINFILYCVMSKKFRETFSEVFYLDLIRSKIFRTTSSGAILPKHSTNTMSTSNSPNTRVIADNNALKCSNGSSPAPLRTKTNASGTYIAVDTGASSITAL